MWEGCLIAFAVAVAVVLGFGWWVFVGSVSPPVMFNCRLTLYVATPQGERVGSGVVQIYRQYENAANRALGFFGEPAMLGEATQVDLDPCGSAFVVLANDPSRYHPDRTRYVADAYLRLVLASFPPDRFHGAWPQGKQPEGDDQFKAWWRAYADELKRVKPKADVLLADLPMIVRFRNISDPASVERVNPNDFAAAFGLGVTLQRATLEITNDPVTTGINEKLPWLERGGPGTFSNTPIYSSTPEQQLTALDFKRE